MMPQPRSGYGLVFALNKKLDAPDAKRINPVAIKADRANVHWFPQDEAT